MSNPTVPVMTLAKLFNLTERRIQQLAKDGIIPKADKGKYDLVAATRAYIKYLQERAMGRIDVEPQNTYAERARLIKAQADKTELEFKTMTAQVIAADQVELLWSGLVSAFRARMLALPTRCAHMVLTLTTYQDIEMCLRSHIYEALHELSRYEPEQSTLNFTEGCNLSSATTDVECKPVGGHAPPVE